MRLSLTELRRLFATAERLDRPVDIDWTNRTLTILADDEGASLKLYVIRDRGNTIDITDRTLPDRK